MEQTERIGQMEQRMERAAQAVMQLSAALDQYAGVQEDIRELAAYYDGDEWRRDLADDEAGRLPKELKRGVLSEDGIWNLLADNRELTERLKEIVQTKPNITTKDDEEDHA